MSKTKDKILAHSLKLFNKEGVDAITVRHIAADMGISHGNLCYHYPNRDDIIKVLYFNMQEEVDKLYGNVDFSSREILDGILFIDKAYEIVYKYRFIVFNAHVIFSRIPEIKEHYTKNVSVRKENLRNLVNTLAAEKLLKKNITPQTFDYLNTQISMIVDFWVPYSEFAHPGSKAEKKDFFIGMLVNVIMPYLSIKGKLQLAKYRKGKYKEKISKLKG